MPSTHVHALVLSLQPGILAIDTSPASDTVLATAGADGDVHVFDRAAERVLASLQGHSKKVNGGCPYWPQTLLLPAIMDGFQIQLSLNTTLAPSRCSLLTPTQLDMGCHCCPLTML